MKVYQLVPRLHEYGGIQRFARDSASAVSVFAEAPLVDLGSTRRGQIGAQILLARYGLRERAKGLDRDLFHHWHVASGANPAAPIDVLTCHGNELLDTRYRPVTRHALQRARAVVSPSRFTRDLTLDLGAIPERSYVVRPAVEIRDARTIVDRDIVRIGVISRFVARKNIAVAMDAAELVAARVAEPVEFHLAGDGPLRGPLLDRMSRLPFRGRYWGAISNAAKFESFLPALTAFVLPALHSSSDVEGFGIAYLEANSVGVPVVGSASGGAAEAIEPGVSGFAVEDPTSAELVADAILAVHAGGSDLRASSVGWARTHSLSSLRAALVPIYTQVSVDGPDVQP